MIDPNYTPYTKEGLKDRRRSKQDGRKLRVEAGRASLGLIATGTAILAVYGAVQLLPGQRDANNAVQESLRAELAGTAPDQRMQKVAQICLAGYKPEQLPTGFPDCNTVLGGKEVALSMIN